MRPSPPEIDFGKAAARLESLSDETLVSAWEEAVEAFLDPSSPERRRTDPPLRRVVGSPAELQLGIEAVLGGLRGASFRRVLAQGRDRRNSSPLLVVLAGNIPALVAQPLLPALALRRPTVVKTSSRVPFFTEAFVQALVGRAPELRDAVLVRTWRGGASEEESHWLDTVSQVVAYGGAESIRSLRDKATGEVLDYGPKLSLAVAVEGASPAAAAPGLVRDVALFEQEGCLSVQMLFVEVGSTEAALLWGKTLDTELSKVTAQWPLAAPTGELIGRVQQVRLEAQSRGCWVSPGPIREGTVIVEELEATPQPSPGLRTLRVYPVQNLSEVRARLDRYLGVLQGVALIGEVPMTLREALRELGVSRFAPAGELQSPTSAWNNGGRDLLEALAEGKGLGARGEGG